MADTQNVWGDNLQVGVVVEVEVVVVVEVVEGEPVFPQSGHKQAEPGDLHGASQVGFPGLFQGMGWLQGRDP